MILSVIIPCFNERRTIRKIVEKEEKRFGIEPEITAKLAQRQARIYEVGISYFGRTYFCRATLIESEPALVPAAIDQNYSGVSS